MDSNQVSLALLGQDALLEAASNLEGTLVKEYPHIRIVGSASVSAVGSASGSVVGSASGSVVGSALGSVVGSA